MEWIKEWIWQIVGIIILSAICDMIMPRGEMKKYVRLVFGLVLVVAVIRPVISVTDLSVAEFKGSEIQRGAAELKSQLDEREQFNVVRLYKEKLCENIKNELALSNEIQTEIKVEIEDKNEKDFGTIKNVTVILHTNMPIQTDGIKKTIDREFGVKAENIRILVLSETA